MLVGVASDIVSEMVYHGRQPTHLDLPAGASSPHGKALIVRGRSLQDVRANALQALLQQLGANPLAFEEFRSRRRWRDRCFR